MKTWLGVLGVSSVMAGALLASCSSVECGPGTVLDGSRCVVDGGGGAGGETAVAGFDGIQAAAPVSTTALLAAWIPADDARVSYHVYVATEEDAFNYSTPQAEAPAGASTLVVPGLEEGATYFVKVHAVVDGKDVENDAVAEVTLVEDTEPPTFAGVESAEPEDDASVLLSWEPATDDHTPEGALVYLVYAAESEEELDLRAPTTVSLPGATSAVVRLPRAETGYVFVVRASDAAGNIDDNERLAESDSGSDRRPPVFSGCKAAVARTASSLAVSWDPATDDLEETANIRYKIYASESPTDFNFASADAMVTGETSAIVPNLERATKYYVVCRAEDAGGNEDENFRLQSATTKADDVPPEFDGNVNLVTLGATTLEISWTEATDNQTAEKDIVYDVYLASEDDPSTLDLVNDVFQSSAPGATSMTVEGLDPNTAYFVFLSARDDGDNRSELGSSLAVTTNVSFSVNVMGIIAQKGCASMNCHTGAAPSSSLNLSSTALAYAQLVDVATASGLGAGFTRVAPNDPENSHLIHRIKGTGPVDPNNLAARMPQDGNLLSEQQISTIELWIAQGAENN